MRYMAPLASTAASTRGYSAPFAAPHAAVKKAGVGRLAHILPALPDAFLFGVRGHAAWRLFEGAIGPERCTNINGQAALAARNKAVRAYWGGCAGEG